MIRVRTIEPPAVIPDWWDSAFRRRQRRLRAVLLRKMSGDVWMTRIQTHQLATNYEREEVTHVLDSLAAAGLVERRDAREPIGPRQSTIVSRSYWRLT